MAVHIVHNGPYMLDHSRWNVEEFIERRAEFEDWSDFIVIDAFIRDSTSP